MSTSLSGYPVVRQEKLFHVGCLDPRHRRDESHEGECLSASTCPEDWTKIARLGGNPVLQLHRPGALFLDAHALTRAMEDALMAEAVEAGILEAITLWSVWRFDEEMDSWITMPCLSREEAEDEVDFHDLEETRAPTPDGDPIEEVRGHVLTEAGQEALGPRFSASPAMARDAALLWLAIRLAADHADVCGVFWDDEHAPERWSAPRHAILPERLDGWMVTGPEGRLPFADYLRAVQEGDPAP